MKKEVIDYFIASSINHPGNLSIIKSAESTLSNRGMTYHSPIYSEGVESSLTISTELYRTTEKLKNSRHFLINMEGVNHEVLWQLGNYLGYNSSEDIILLQGDHIELDYIINILRNSQRYIDKEDVDNNHTMLQESLITLKSDEDIAKIWYHINYYDHPNTRYLINIGTESKLIPVLIGYLYSIRGSNNLFTYSEDTLLPNSLLAGSVSNHYVLNGKNPSDIGLTATTDKCSLVG